MKTLSSTQVRIAETAAGLFLARGFRRTSMAELATAAGLSRQGLYNYYPAKGAVFAAAIRLLSDRLLLEIASTAAPLKTSRDRLILACDRWSVAVFSLQRTHPDARDMDDLSFTVVREAYEAFVRLVATLLPDNIDRLEKARMLVFAARGFAGQAQDEARLRLLIARMIDLLLPG